MAGGGRDHVWWRSSRDQSRTVVIMQGSIEVCGDNGVIPYSMVHLHLLNVYGTVVLEESQATETMRKLGSLYSILTALC